ncbi:chorismate mutase [Isosphaera pallida ATCC 43644]|jgi:chorismate mutase/prephenate dehydratase|uniref:Bifunctional chorismate mutase/prephenate dehydratase n=1 Tax=Isosphaera pallida (strain ATCC 43644 / DSM 9630 / IS1B) TaxID=575540 RepID=E8R198_ISOPI|nr:prephenate dehydratase [Isosphaera pallida]ADV61304.1 chorismate mutase [Isosphaera pallida ATCC 43644]
MTMSDDSSNAAPSSGSAPPSDPAEELARHRARIDELDHAIVELLNERAKAAIAIGEVKKKHGLEVWSPGREAEVLNRVLASNRGPLHEETLRSIFRELMSGSRKLQQKTRVACLGPEFSYSHLALLSKFGDGVEAVTVGTIAAVFEEVDKRRVEYGIVPLENSTDGRIADTLDMFVKLPRIRIRSEVRLRIHHCLAARCRMDQVRQVYSRPQALSQCRHWLAKNLPHAALIESLSTAAAAERARNEEYAAAIASRPAALAHGLILLAENIEDQGHNVTRFAVLSDRPEEPTGDDKTTIMLKLGNRAGSLVRALEPFLLHHVNMTWIESFPDPTSSQSDRDPSYLFFIDLDGHAREERLARTLREVEVRCQQLEILGSYPRGQHVES